MARGHGLLCKGVARLCLLVPPPPLSCPTPGKTPPPTPWGTVAKWQPPPPPGEPHYHRTRTFSGTEIALQKERIQHKMRSKGCQCTETNVLSFT